MIKAHWLSIFSFKSYQLFSHATKWQVFWFWLYLFLLGSFAFNLYFNQTVSKNLPLFLKNFPEVTFQKGQLTAPNDAVNAPITGTDLSILFDKNRPFPPTASDFAAKNTFLIVTEKTMYIPAGTGIDSRPLPPQLDFTTSQAFLTSHTDEIKGLLSAIGFITSFILCALMLVFGFCLAGSAGFFMRAVMRVNVPMGVISRWAAFLQGPVIVLWILNLFFSIPLFTLAMIILCLIYMQQILNTFNGMEKAR